LESADLTPVDRMKPLIPIFSLALNKTLPFGMRVDFLHFDGIKRIERATMTRIGCCQIKTHNLLAMLPPGETISPRSKFSRPHRVDQYQCANRRSAVP
jgi:hypothetical protein